MLLIAGLGNPGPRYLYTRHNAGFMAVDFLLDRFGIAQETLLVGRSPLYKLSKFENVYVVKPMSFMNLSGEPVKAAINYLNIESLEKLVVVHDDIDVPLGDVRKKFSGGAGGHNGLISIVDTLGSNEFHRIRVGVGRPPEGLSVVDHVLSQFYEDEVKTFEDALDEACDIAETFFS